MKKARVFFIQLLIFLSMAFLINSVSWLILNLMKDATFVDSERWDNNKAFKDSSFANELYDENQSVKSIYEPFTAWRQKLFLGKYIKTGVDGERNFGLHRKINNKNVRLFGGSTMWGVGSSDDSTIAAFLSRDNKKMNFFNHGMQGYNSRQALEKLITIYQKGNVSDIVIFYDGVNEISMCSKTISLPGHFQEDLFRLNVSNRNTILRPSDIIWKGFSQVFVNSTLEIAQKINNKLFNGDFVRDCEIGYVCDCDDKRAEDIAKIVVNNWEIAKVIVEKNGGKFIAVLQPVFSEGNPNISYLEVNKKPYLMNYAANYSNLYLFIRKEIKKRNINWVHDFTNVLNGQNPYFIDFCHTNAGANFKISRELSILIKNSLE